MTFVFWLLSFNFLRSSWRGYWVSKLKLSVSRLWHENRLKTKFGRQCYLKSPTGSKYLLSSQHSPYLLTAETGLSPRTSLKQPNFDARLWHSRFMHSGNTKMRQMSQKYPFLSPYDFDSSKCDICLQGGARKQHFGPKHFIDVWIGFEVVA